MAVQIKDKPDFSFFTQLEEKSFDWCHFRHIGFFFSWVPFSIKIFSWKVGPVVSENNSVGINHRNHIDDVVFAEELPLLRPFLDDPVNDPVAHEWPLGFPRMLSRHYDDCLSSVFFFTALGGNNECFNTFLWDGFSGNGFGD